MASNEERIAALHKRAEILKKERKERMYQGTAFSLLFVMNIALALYIYIHGEPVSFEKIPAGMNAAIFAKGNALGYVFVAVVSFLLGAFVTVFCYYLKKRQGRDEH